MSEYLALTRCKTRNCSGVTRLLKKPKVTNIGYKLHIQIPVTAYRELYGLGESKGIWNATY
jgi:hypothetical protein